MCQAVDKGGYQKELPDIWLTDGNPWEVKRSEIKYEVCFGGKTETKNGASVWTPNQKVPTVSSLLSGMAYGLSFMYSCAQQWFYHMVQ